MTTKATYHPVLAKTILEMQRGLDVYNLMIGVDMGKGCGTTTEQMAYVSDGKIFFEKEPSRVSVCHGPCDGRMCSLAYMLGKTCAMESIEVKQ